MYEKHTFLVLTENCSNIFMKIYDFRGVSQRSFMSKTSMFLNDIMIQ